MNTIIQSSKRFGLKTIGVISALALIASCNSQPNPESERLMVTQNPNVHLAFSGGGWRAHTVHSGLIMSLLQANGCTAHDESCLTSALSNVQTISSNSGGSWFNSMLNYNSNFTTQITASDAFSQWSKKGGGWLGEQQSQFDAHDTICNHLAAEEYAYLFCVGLGQAPSVSDGLDWYQLLEDLVYTDYSIGDVKLGDQRGWSQDKTLLFAGTLMNNDVVVNQNLGGLEAQYYQTCPEGAEADHDGGLSAGAHCKSQSDGSPVADPLDVMPVTFTSPPSTRTITIPDVFASPNLTKNIGYTTSARADLAELDRSQFPDGTIHTSDTKVIGAAAASSSAGGYVAAQKTSGNFTLSQIFNSMASTFGISNGSVNFVDPNQASGLALSDMKAQTIFKVADGGVVDNTAVIQLIRYLQKNGGTTNQQIIAFDNTNFQFQFSNAGTTYGFSTDVGAMFKDAGPAILADIKIFGYSLDQIAVTRPNTQLFDTSSLKAPDWSWTSTDGNNRLFYTRFENLKVLANPDYDVQSGTLGTLHLFSVVSNGTQMSPTSVNFADYTDMLSAIENGLPVADSQGKSGQDYLLEAFGLQ